MVTLIKKFLTPQDGWSSRCFLTECTDKVVSLTCQRSVIVMKGCNSRRHYKKECEEKYKDLTDELGENKIRQLKLL
jgi:hypothetical protein